MLNERTQRGLIRITSALFLLVGLLGASILAYSAFYHAYVPSLAYVSPVYLHYATPTQPHAFMTFKAEQGLLAQDQPYDVTLEMDVFPTERNYNAGNFMVDLQLLDAHNETVYTSIRPSIVPYHSPVLRLAKTLFYLPLLLTSLTTETMHVTIPMMEAITVPARAGIHFAAVSISSPLPLDVVKVSLQFKAHLSGLRYLMYYWRLPTALFFIVSFLTWSILFAAISWRVLSAWWNERQFKESEEAMEFEEEPVSQVTKMQQELEQIVPESEASYEQVEEEE